MKTAISKTLRKSVTSLNLTRNLSNLSLSKRAFANIPKNNKLSSYSSKNENVSSNSLWKLLGSIAAVGSVATVSSITFQVAFAEEKKDTNPNFDKPEHYKYIIVGGGTAGFHALQEILKADKEARVLVVTDEPFKPYNRTPLSKELWKSDDPNVAENLKFKDWAGNASDIWFQFEVEEKDRVTFVHGTVLDVDIHSKSIFVDTKTTYTWDKILLATGGYPRSLPGIPEEVRDNVVTYRYLKDFKRMEKLTNEAEHIVVIGGGFLGSELAVGLKTRGKNHNLKVTQVFPENGLMGLVFPKELSDYATEKVRKDVGVEVLPSTTVKKYEQSNGKLKLTLSNGQVLDNVDQVVVSVGIHPDNALASRANLEVDSKNGGIVANTELSAASDVYVAGDVLSYWEPVLGRRRVEHYDHAVATGRLAGRNMTGEKNQYSYLPFFWSDLGPLGYEAVGNLDGKLKKVLVFEKNENNETKDFKRGVVYYLDDNRKVVGVLLWGVFGKTDEARYAIINSNLYNKKYEKDEDLIKLVSLEQDHH